MAKIKSSKSAEVFSKEVLGLDEYDRWLIATKNKIIVSIVNARNEKSLSQLDLAKMLNTTQSVISRVENGTSKHTTLDYLMRIARVLGVLSKVTLKKVA